MEELQDAIEDAQYVNAIATQEDGPRPVLAWDKPTPEAMEAWEAKKLASDSKAFDLETLMESPIGLFLFSSYVKTHHDDYLRMNFCEDIIRYKKARGKTKLEMGHRLANRYISRTEETKPPSRTEIHECDLSRMSTVYGSELLKDDTYQQAMDYPTCSESFVGLKGKIREEVYRNWTQQEKAERSRKTESPNRSAVMEAAKQDEEKEGRTEDENSDSMSNLEESAMMMMATSVRNSKAGAISGIQTTESMRSLTQKFKSSVSILRDDVFDIAEALVLESLKKDYLEGFRESEEYTKLKNFMWYGDRRVVYDDFFSMRVLGRGGFGLVTGKYAKVFLC